MLVERAVWDGELVFCEACAAELGRQVPNPTLDDALAAVRLANAAVESSCTTIDALKGVITAQRAEISLLADELAAALELVDAEPSPKPPAKPGRK